MSTADRARLIAETAWRHLVNRHDLTQVLDELGATSDDPDQLLTALDQAANLLNDRRSGNRPPAPPAHRPNPGPPQ